MIKLFYNQLTVKKIDSFINLVTGLYNRLIDGSKISTLCDIILLSEMIIIFNLFLKLLNTVT